MASSCVWNVGTDTGRFDCVPDSGTLELVKSSCTYQGEGTFGKSCSSDGAQNCSRCFVPSSQKLRNNLSYPEDENISCHVIGFKHASVVRKKLQILPSRSCRCIWLRSFYFFVVKDGYYHRNASCIAKKCTCTNGTLPA